METLCHYLLIIVYLAFEYRCNNFQYFYSLCMFLFLTNVETLMVTTALIEITKNLVGSDYVNWITSPYIPTRIKCWRLLLRGLSLYQYSDRLCQCSDTYVLGSFLIWPKKVVYYSLITEQI